MKKTKNQIRLRIYKYCMSIMAILAVFLVLVRSSFSQVVADSKTLPKSQELDFGDAPDPPFHTLVSNQGARHIIDQNLFLGNIVDGEVDGQQNENANGDDIDGSDDDDGVVFTTELKPANSASIDVTASGNGFLNAWIDFDGNGDWGGAGEKIFISQSLTSGVNTLSFAVPAASLPGYTFARFRFSTDIDLLVTGLASDGEVEDYRIIITADTLDFGDAPDDDTFQYMTILPQGAYHRLSDTIYLGSHNDGEMDGQPDRNAEGDDLNWIDDEDGVDIPLLVPGGTATIGVHSVGKGTLRAWFDFNANGLWDDPAEYVLEVPLGTGDHELDVPVPPDAIVGNTYARFRYSIDRSLQAAGPGSEGEVEDYLITVVQADSLDFGDAPEDYPTTLLENGARHPVSREIYLGLLMPDSEYNGEPDSDAEGDDRNDIDDEDGVVLLDPLVPDKKAMFRVTTQGIGVLRVWIDWNADGDWGDAGEFVLNHYNWSGATTHDLGVPVPHDAVVGDTYARFRYSMDRRLSYDGLGSPGEVEDYVYRIVGGDTLDFGDAPDQYYTLLANDGASHPIDDGIYLGGRPDGEDDGQPDVGAAGDDGIGLDDEDGVLMPTLVPGQRGKIKVTTHLTTFGLAYLHGWIDFNGDGDWDDMGENIFSGLNLNDGVHLLDVDVPSDAVVGETYARFRYSYDEELGYSKLGDRGEVEDHIVQIVLDFGDAPDDKNYHYRTLLTNDGARHLPNSDLYLGYIPDGEIDGQASSEAAGDDLLGMNDEDGVVIPVLVPGSPSSLTVTAHSTLGEQMFHAWIDFNGDGNWDDPDEKVFENYSLADGIHTMIVTVPSDAVSGPTFARFRYGPNRDLDYFGDGDIGEVEDYRVLIDERKYDFGDAPDDGAVSIYPTLMVNNGAAHLIDPEIYLGELIDAENDGQPHENAQGDDIAAVDDDDGVVFNSNLIPGETASITVTASVDGKLAAWIDFNGDGDWLDTDEEIFNHNPVSAGPNSLNFNVPNWAEVDNVIMRFRFYTGDVIMPEGSHFFSHTFPNGEVEDYMVEIVSAADAIKWYQPPLKSPKSYFHNSFWGWNEISIHTRPIIADDWFCADPRPVTAIRWWGSYQGWDSVVPPDLTPNRFHITIWTNDTLETAPRGIGHPDSVIWTQTVFRNQVNETWVGSDFSHDSMMEPDSCFSYRFDIPEADWFLQQDDSTTYWLTISARYEDEIPDEYGWGWTTRERYFRNDGLRILAPIYPDVDSLYWSGEVVKPGWDMTFILYTTTDGTFFDFGDASDPEYPTAFESNGGHHMIWPGMYLGDGVDSEPDGQSNTEALWDDMDGSDDEDGVEFTSDLVPGDFATVTVNASGPGLLTAWIDYDGDGDWDDPGEHVLIDMPLIAGNNNLTFNVPIDATVGTTSARFRFCVVPGIPPKGLAIGGEVEDYEVTITGPTTVEEQENLDRVPRKFKLMQNYPNPFNPETTIKFSLPRVSEVLLTIFDVYGREVRTLLHGEWSPGSHGVVWDGRDRNGQIVSTGMYFYRIDVRTLVGEQKKYVDVKKMIFMK